MTKKLKHSVMEGDCIHSMEWLRRNKKQPQLIIADPPYNYGQDYDDHDDNMSDDTYLEFTHNWLREASRLLDPNGSMWVIIPDEYAGDVDVFCRRTLGLHQRNWVVWFYTFGQNCKAKFNRSHTHLLYYTKKPPLGRKLKKDEKPPFTFNREPVLVPSARSLIYKDKRAKAGGKLPDDVWMLLKHQVDEALDPVGDSWCESRVCGTFKERKSVSPNQIPVPILARIIAACSNPGDLVVDPFCGTGSTGEASVLLDRSFTGIDKSKACVETTKERIDNTKKAFEAQKKLDSEQMLMFAEA